MIELKKPAEIEKLRVANQIVAKTLDFLILSLYFLINLAKF